MIRIEIDEPTLARTRIATSPYAEATCSLYLLHRNPGPGTLAVHGMVGAGPADRVVDRGDLGLPRRGVPLAGLPGPAAVDARADHRRAAGCAAGDAGRGDRPGHPAWLVSGMLVPITVLPAWTAPIAAVLPTTWGARALREATSGGPVWPSALLCLAISLICLTLGGFALTYVERRARAAATLALA